MSTDPSRLSRWSVKVHRALARPNQEPANSLVDELARLRRCVDTLPHQSSMLSICKTRRWTHAGDQVRRQIGVTLRDLQYALSHCERAVREVAPHPPSLRLVHEELCQLFDEFDGCGLDMQAGILSVVTDPIILEGLALGPFRIEIELAQLEINDPSRWLKVVALSPNTATCDEAVTHPHVRDERLCTGDATMAISNALGDGRVCDVLMMVRSILATYNAHSPFVRIEDWDGRACYDCGSIADADSAFFCEHCDHDYCDDCTSYCRRCDETRCRGCLSDCPICNEACCGGCLSGCQRCRVSACADCMEEGICQPCLNGENEEPDFDETTDEPVEQEGTGQPIQAEQTGDTRLVTSSKQVL